jgi:hypothetical protein
MPTIANPHGIGTYEPRHSRPKAGDWPTSSLGSRVKVAARRIALTEQLANGADPTSTPELALRAAQLTSDRQRRQMARALRRTISEARDPAVTRGFVSIINRRAVLEANDAMQATIARLASPDPVRVKGMAMLEHMLTDGLTSPIYNRAEPGTLGSRLTAARAELDPAPNDSPVAV